MTVDTPELRKARGAFFTDERITQHLADWAIRNAHDQVFEPSAGEAAFLRAAVARLSELGAEQPVVFGAELHKHSAKVAHQILEEAGGIGNIRVIDFFKLAAKPKYDAIIGNPPFIRYQDWTGAQRDRARFAALQQGVALTGLASSWAAFLVHAAGFLRDGGRLGMVLPAELLSVNYAAPVRRFLLESFEHVELVTFEEQVFPDAEADTVLVKAAGYRGTPEGEATLRQTTNAASLSELEAGTNWRPVTTTDRWLSSPLHPRTTDSLTSLLGDGSFVRLIEYGETTLGAVTGGNRYFTMSPQRAADLGIPPRDLVKISPPGSSHLRGLALTDSSMTRLGQEGSSTRLLYPSDNPADKTLDYIQAGVDTGADQAYKCKVRSPWWRTPILDAPDLFLTYMNADTVRLVTNKARARHLNSVHGVYLSEEHRDLGQQLLPIAALNSVTLLSAELTGRSYGGGILKMEPREADRWAMPSPPLVAAHGEELEAAKPRVQAFLQAKNLLGAVELIDSILLRGISGLAEIRADRQDWANRRTTRGKSGGKRSEER